MIDLKKCKLNKEEMKDALIGKKFEMEHTNNPKLALKIAMQHECEFPMYYKNGLIPMEKRLKKR